MRLIVNAVILAALVGTLLYFGNHLYGELSGEDFTTAASVAGAGEYSVAKGMKKELE